MFKSAKKKSLKAKEKIDFKLEFHATRVPQRGWDKLMVSLISVDSNKVTAKTGKVPVKNGVCTWAEPVYESPLLNLDVVEKDSRKAPYKLLVSTGLSRFGILGEATIDFADYVQSDTPTSLSLQLQNCASGSLLHVKIQQLGLNATAREFGSLQEIQRDHQIPFFDVNERCIKEASVGPVVVTDKDECTSTSCLSSDSLEAPQTPEVSEFRTLDGERTGRGEFASPCSSIGSCSGRQDPGYGSQDGVSHSEAGIRSQRCIDNAGAEKASMQSSFSQSHTAANGERYRVTHQLEPSEVLPWTNMKSSELDMAVSTFKELSVQSICVEQRFKQTELQIEFLQRQHLEERTRNEELQRSLASLKEERDNLKLEMDSLPVSGNALDRGGDGMKWRELQEELEYEKSVNSNLSLQLRKTQESNAELLLEVQDLERLLLDKKGQDPFQENTLVHQNSTEKELKTKVDSLKREIEEQERDSHELTEENMSLLLQLKQANDTVKTKEDMIAQLELKVKNDLCFCAETESDKHEKELVDLKLKLVECAESYENKLSSCRTLIDDLNSSVMMVRSKNACVERELQSTRELISDLHKEVESLKLKKEGLEKERSLFLTQKGQLNLFREKVSKAEQEYRVALKRVEELESLNKDLKLEKTKDLTTLKKQLQDFQEHAVVADGKCKDLLQNNRRLKDEKLNFEKEISTLQRAKEAAEANVSQLQSFNMVLQETLHVEQGKSAELVQQFEEKDARNIQLGEEVRMTRTQLTILEQTVTGLESSVKELEVKTGTMQAENMVCMSQIKGLEVQRESLEEQKLTWESTKSALEGRLLHLDAFNEELSEKLKNAQEDVDWARENTNTLVNEIRELEGELKSDMVIQQHLKQSLSELESQKLHWQSQLDELSNKNVQLVKNNDVLEKRCKDVLNDKDALFVVVREQKIEHDSRETSLNAVIKEQEEKLQQLAASCTEDRIQQLLEDASHLRDEKSALGRDLKLLQDTLVQAKKDATDNEHKAEQALLEASMQTDEKLELEENVLKLEQMLKQAEKDASSLKQNLDFQFQEYTSKEQDMIKLLNEVTRQAQILQEEKLELLQKVMGLEAQCAAADLERRKLSVIVSKMESDLEALQRERDVQERAMTVLEAQIAAAEQERRELSTAMSKLKTESDALQMEKENKERTLAGLKEEKETLKISLGTMFKIESDLEVLQKEKDIKEQAFQCLKVEKERLKASLQIAEEELATMEERLREHNDASIAWEQSKALLKNSTDELIKAKQEINDLNKAKLEGAVVREELQKQVSYLEEELWRKTALLASMELKANESESPPHLLDNSPLRAERGLSAYHSSLEARESADLHEKVKPLEEELKVKTSELELSRQCMKEQQQSEKLILCRQEDGHLRRMTSKESMDKEIQSLQEEKRVLELALSNFSAAANNDRLSKKVAVLEMELAEVLEANNMYKNELQSAFAEPHNVYTAALEKLGSVEQVIKDLGDLRRKNMMLEDELKDMQQRYFNMSLQFVEGEAEREELVMTIRNLRGSKKLLPHKSVNF